MPSRQSFLASTVGSKLLVAVTGFALFGFLILHLAGNLLVYGGPDTFNHYSEQLLRNPFLIPAELSLLALFLLHSFKAVRLVWRSRRARPDGYAVKRRAGYPSRKNVASSTMILTGLFLLLFVPLHLKTFKYGAHYQTVSEPPVRDLYRLVVEIYSHPGYVVFYIVSMVLVGLHLWHGVSSAFQTVGVDAPRWTPALRRVGWAMAAVISGGFMTIPIWIFFFGAPS
jgi:succinate dehydrogenase / fumarate reductase, cytochrome b subunit